MRDGRQVQTGVGRTTGTGHNARRVLQRFQRDDVTGADVFLKQVHNRQTGRSRVLVAAFIRRGRTGRVHQRKADRLGHTGHSVRGELTTTGTSGRTRHALQRGQFFVRVLACLVTANGLEHVLNGDVLALEPAWHDRTAVDEDGRHVQTHHRHHHTRQGFVTASQTNNRVIAVTAHCQFNGIRNRFARCQRRTHAFVAHRDTVGHGDRGEFARRAGTFFDAQLNSLRLTVQRDVTRRCFVPAGCNTNQRLVDFIFAHAHRVIVRTVRRAGRTLGYVTAGQFRLIEGAL